ncbi:MAG: tRNA-intron lyase [Candidatus Micrarchaeota archaeon]
MALKIEKTKNGFIASDDSTVQSLLKGFFGEPIQGKKNKLFLSPEEGLYLMEVRNAECNGQTFNEAAKEFSEQKKFLASYYCYKEWRDHGIIARQAREAKQNYGRNPLVKYPSEKLKLKPIHFKALFFTDDLMAVIDDPQAKELYDKYWLGQWGTYKAKKHGNFLKLDVFETLFLIKHAGLNANITTQQLEKKATARRSDFKKLFQVYEDFRLKGFVVKTGFKFGTHFRLYFPGAAPSLENSEWLHSKHVIQVFPRESKLLISEWARAIRVAHSVKKTFILAIPGKKEAEKIELDYLLYHRKDGIPENPEKNFPTYAMLALSEEEEIGGAELAKAIEKSKKLGLDLMLAICDRETSVTFYRVKRIELPESKFEYYEIEWEQP